MADTEGLNGSCLCGAVEFSAQTPSNWCSHCHCTMCQRAHGAAFVTWVGFERSRVTLRGEQLHWHRSSEDSERGFCARCGTTLFFRSDRWPTELHITRANFHSDIDRAPEGHSYFDTHVGWFEFSDTQDSSPPK